MIKRANVIWLDESDKNKTNVIYMLIFPNWKYYIGQTTQKLKDRIKKGHVNISNNPLTKKERAIKKYKTFHVMVLDNCKDLDELNKKEKYWIELYNTFNNGYNSTTGGDSCRVSDETRKKIQNANKGKKHSDETKKKISSANKGRSINMNKIVSDETRKRMSESHKGKTLSDEHRRRISENNKRSNLGKKLSDEIRKLISDNSGRSVRCKSIPDNIIFDSIKQCRDYYSKYDKWLKVYDYLDNNKIHKKSGQTFIRLG